MHQLSEMIEQYKIRNFRGFLRYMLFKEYSKRTYLKNRIMCWYRKQIFIEQVNYVGDGLQIGPEPIEIIRKKGSNIHIGKDVVLYSPMRIISATHIFPESHVDIGDRTRIGAFTEIRAAKKIKIGMDCLIARWAKIYDYNGHPLTPGSYRNVSTLRNVAPTPPEEVKEIYIGNNVWIGENAIIQKGVVIGDGAVISANAVVIKDVPPNSVVFGNPARVILWLDKFDKFNEKEIV